MPAAVRTLLQGLIDYAGLFPPAKLPMAAAVRNYADYRTGPDADGLGRFIVPVGQLAEFNRAATEVAAGNLSAWRLSVLSSGDPVDDERRIREFNAQPNGPRIVALETKADHAEGIARLSGAFPPALEVWIEIPASSAALALVAEIRRIGRGAKLRTGGVTAEAFPAAEAVACFLRECLRAGVTAKATAGLHHPITGRYPLTYDEGSATCLMFGFVNLFIAAALLSRGAPDEQVTAVLTDATPANFRATPATLAWKDLGVSGEEVQSTRRKLLRSFGSCSFLEPIEGLKALHWL